MKKTDWSAPLRDRLPEAYFTKMIDFINQVYGKDGQKNLSP